MTTVFITYRQSSEAERAGVRALAERLRATGIDVVLDQFLMEAKPGGPPEGWPKWSSDRALQTERVLIIGTPAWFRCFEGREKPGVGLGAACEAADVRQRIYNAAGINEDIRVVIMDDSDAAGMPGKLEPYHRFHCERDFVGLVRWLGGRIPDAGRPVAMATTTPNNLPRLQAFFGRTTELAAIREALDPDNRTWGALIDGPGGMGKTSLAIKAAYDCPPGQFDQIIFVTVKDREMDDEGQRKLTGFILPGFLEMLNEVARELGQPDITKSPTDQRARLVLEALRPARALLILDNLESLPKDDRDQLFTFVKRLPEGCKAILTSRRRIGSGSELLILEKLDQAAALATLADLARHSALLAKTSEAERVTLWRQTGGNPLLLRWVAGQLGRGACRTFTDALHFLQACPADNDPLEFVFGDLVNEFTADETQVLVALAHFSLPAKVAHIAVIAGSETAPVEAALRSMANRSLVVPDQEETAYSLVPMVADFLRRKRPDVFAETGTRLSMRAHALILENGFGTYELFPVLDSAWPTVAPALPLLIAGPNATLQLIRGGLRDFLNFTGRWDEALSISQHAESRAVAAADWHSAVVSAEAAAYVHYLRGEPDALLECADRAERYLAHVPSSTQVSYFIPSMRGRAHELYNDYASAIAAYRHDLKLARLGGRRTHAESICLQDIADVEKKSGDYAAAERDYLESLRIAREQKLDPTIAVVIWNLADLAFKREDWKKAEKLACEAVDKADGMGRLDLIGIACYLVAASRIRMGRSSQGLSHAKRAVAILTQLKSPNLNWVAAQLRQSFPKEL